MIIFIELSESQDGNERIFLIKFNQNNKLCLSLKR